MGNDPLVLIPILPGDLREGGSVDLCSTPILQIKDERLIEQILERSAIDVHGEPIKEEDRRSKLHRLPEDFVIRSFGDHEIPFDLYRETGEWQPRHQYATRPKYVLAGDLRQLDRSNAEYGSCDLPVLAFIEATSDDSAFVVLRQSQQGGIEMEET